MTPAQLEWWKALARGYAVGGTEEQIDAIARRAGQRHPEQRDQSIGIWHASWEVLGKRGDCNCVSCRRSRRQSPVKL